MTTEEKFEARAFVLTGLLCGIIFPNWYFFLFAVALVIGLTFYDFRKERKDEWNISP